MNSQGQLKRHSVSDKALRNMYATALQAKLYDSLLDIAKERIIYYEARIQLADAKDSLTIASYEKELSIWREKEVIYKDAIAALQKEIRKLRRQIFWMKLSGVGIAATTVYLLITK